MPPKNTPPSQQRDYVRKYRRKRYTVTGNGFIRGWRERNPEKRAKYRDDWKARHPEKYKAHNTVGAAVRAGRLMPASALLCFDCGAPAQEYDHYLGYAPEHRLDVQPLCRACHGKRRWIA